MKQNRSDPASFGLNCSIHSSRNSELWNYIAFCLALSPGPVQGPQRIQRLLRPLSLSLTHRLLGASEDKQAEQAGGLKRWKRRDVSRARFSAVVSKITSKEQAQTRSHTLTSTLK